MYFFHRVIVLFLVLIIISQEVQAFYLHEAGHKVFSRRATIKNLSAECGPMPPDASSQEYIDWMMCGAAQPAPPLPIPPIVLPEPLPPVPPMPDPALIPVALIDHCVPVNALRDTIKEGNNNLINQLTALVNSLSEMISKMQNYLNQISSTNIAVQKTFLAMQQTSVCTAPGYTSEDWSNHNPDTSFQIMQDALGSARSLLNRVNSLLSQANDRRSQLDSIACTEDNYSTVTNQLSDISSNLADDVLEAMEFPQQKAEIASNFSAEASLFKSKIASFLAIVDGILTAHSPINVPTIINECDPGISPASKRRKFAIKQVPLRKRVARLIDGLRNLADQLPEVPVF